MDVEGNRMLTGSWAALRIDFVREQMAIADGSKAFMQGCGRELKDVTVFPHAAQVLALDMDLEHDLVLTGCSDGIARLWTASGKVVQSFQGHEDAVTTVALDATQGLVLTGSRDCYVKIWDLGGQLLATLPHHGPVAKVTLRRAAKTNFT